VGRACCTRWTAEEDEFGEFNEFPTPYARPRVGEYWTETNSPNSANSHKTDTNSSEQRTSGSNHHGGGYPGNPATPEDKSTPRERRLTQEQTEGFKRLRREGMSAKWARAEVLGEEVLGEDAEAGQWQRH
jgi:hypothetical protein